MASRAAMLIVAAILALCAFLGLLDSVHGVLMLAPFVFLMAPLLAGIDPAVPAVERLVGLLAADRPAGRPAPGPALPAFIAPRSGLIAWERPGARGPPAPRFI